MMTKKFCLPGQRCAVIIGGLFGAWGTKGGIYRNSTSGGIRPRQPNVCFCAKCTHSTIIAMSLLTACAVWGFCSEGAEDCEELTVMVSGADEGD